ncbi:MAG: DUF433 domain-containing protein [Acidobacteria bacterium]|nr:DUF433 domain-containing protein [Acidobacteriota bacterium]
MNWADCKAELGGQWCFAGTRMPVASLFEHLDEGSTLAHHLRPHLVTWAGQLGWQRFAAKNAIMIEFMQRGQVRRVDVHTL